MQPRICILSTVTLSTAMFFGIAAMAAEKSPELTLDTAQKIVAGAQARATEKGMKMDITIVDTGANRLAFVRMDGATLASLLISEMKAETAAKTGYATREVGEWAHGKDGKPPCCRGIEMVPGFITFPAACRSRPPTAR
jgi:glc operon protein GlcG